MQICSPIKDIEYDKPQWKDYTRAPVDLTDTVDAFLVMTTCFAALLIAIALVTLEAVPQLVAEAISHHTTT